jgi:hypothetical protein
MKQLHTSLLVVLFGVLASISSAADRWETLKAINMVENPTNHTGYGSRGELGPYQFRSSTWRAYTKQPFTMANDRKLADQVAVKHYEWLKKRLHDAGIDANSYNIAMAWNCGITAVINGRIPLQSYHYAERVKNLVEVYARTETPVEVPLVRTHVATQSIIRQFKLTSDLEVVGPAVKIVNDPIPFRIAGSTSRFVLPPTNPKFVVVVN